MPPFFEPPRSATAARSRIALANPGVQRKKLPVIPLGPGFLTVTNAGKVGVDPDGGYWIVAALNFRRKQDKFPLKLSNFLSNWDSLASYLATWRHSGYPTELKNPRTSDYYAGPVDTTPALVYVKVNGNILKGAGIKIPSSFDSAWRPAGTIVKLPPKPATNKGGNPKDTQATTADGSLDGEEVDSTAVDGGGDTDVTGVAGAVARGDIYWNLPPAGWSGSNQNAQTYFYYVPGQAKARKGGGRRWPKTKAYGLKGTLGSIVFDGIPGGTAEDQAQYGPSSDFGSGRAVHRYGCLFHFNPPALNTSLGANANVNLANVSNGIDAGTSLVAMSYVTVTLLFDRSLDLQGGNASSGPDRAYYETLYGNAHVGSGYDGWKRYKEVWNLGTLHDIDYLVATTKGYREKVPWKTQYGAETNHVWWADTGYLMMGGAMLNLGPFQYYGYIESLDITHTKFTRGMIPMVSEVSVSFARRPDVVRPR